MNFNRSAEESGFSFAPGMRANCLAEYVTETGAVMASLREGRNSLRSFDQTGELHFFIRRDTNMAAVFVAVHFSLNQ